MTADGVVVKEGDWISVDGGTGEAFLGQMPLHEFMPDEEKLLEEVIAMRIRARRRPFDRLRTKPG